MSEGDWSSEGTSLAPPKRRIPLWVWGCGGGCALFLLVGVVVAVFGFRMIKKAADPEANWAAVDEVLPVVERPQGYTIFSMPFRIDGLRMWFLEASDGSHQVMLMHARAGDSADETRRELFRESGKAAQRGTLQLQGHELTVLRFDSQISGGGQGGAFEDMMKRFAEGAHANVDLSGAGSDDLLVLIYTERGAKAQVDDEELIEFLSHFRLPAASALAEPPAEPAASDPPGDPSDGEQDGEQEE